MTCSSQHLLGTWLRLCIGCAPVLSQTMPHLSGSSESASQLGPELKLIPRRRGVGSATAPTEGISWACGACPKRCVAARDVPHPVGPSHLSSTGTRHHERQVLSGVQVPAR